MEFMAMSCAQDRDMVELVEGEEPAEFWEPLGGKQKYASFSPSEVPKPPRLFHCKPPRYSVAGVCDILAYSRKNVCQHECQDENIDILPSGQASFVADRLRQRRRVPRG